MTGSNPVLFDNTVLCQPLDHRGRSKIKTNAIFSPQSVPSERLTQQIFGLFRPMSTHSWSLLMHTSNNTTWLVHYVTFQILYRLWEFAKTEHLKRWKKESQLQCWLDNSLHNTISLARWIKLKLNKLPVGHNKVPVGCSDICYLIYSNE
jgi:hypothetical protein